MVINYIKFLMEQKWYITNKMDQIQLIELKRYQSSQLLLLLVVVIIFMQCMYRSISLHLQKPNKKFHTKYTDTTKSKNLDGFQTYIIFRKYFVLEYAYDHMENGYSSIEIGNSSIGIISGGVGIIIFYKKQDKINICVCHIWLDWILLYRNRI